MLSIYTDFPKPSCINSVLLLFLSYVGTTNVYSKAAWELYAAILNPPGESTQITRRFYSCPVALEQLLHTTVRVFREICEDSKSSYYER
jgi:hypothetical protein